FGNSRSLSSQTESKGGREGRKSFDGRKKLLWDGEKMKITNYDSANAFVKRDYRTGWSL
ncbi:MAG: gfo/Idh/MocA family oxidoreductase, partial [Bacteroidota bacterium]